MEDDALTVAGEKLGSRLILGTGGAPSMQVVAEVLTASRTGWKKVVPPLVQSPLPPEVSPSAFVPSYSGPPESPPSAHTVVWIRPLTRPPGWPE